MPRLGKGRIASIQGARGVAAWLVVLGHANVALSEFTGAGFFLSVRPVAAALSHFGVDLFFVISGAIMFLLYGRRGTETGIAACGVFFVKRVLRIYPLFWVTSVVGALVLSAPTVEMPDISFAKQILLIRSPGFNLVAWTLVYEMHFYVLVGLMLRLSFRRTEVGFAILSVLIVTGVLWFPPDDLPIPSLFTYHLMTEFVFGVLLAAAFVHLDIDGRITFGVGTVLLIVSIAVLPDDIQEVARLRVLLLGIPAAFLLHGVMTMERSGIFRTPRILERAGDRSYSIYLWHVPLLFWPVKSYFLGSVAGALLSVSISILCIIAVSEMSYRWIEKPFVRSGNRITRRTKPLAMA